MGKLPSHLSQRWLNFGYTRSKYHVCYTWKSIFDSSEWFAATHSKTLFVTLFLADRFGQMGCLCLFHYFGESTKSAHILLTVPCLPLDSKPMGHSSCKKKQNLGTSRLDRTRRLTNTGLHGTWLRYFVGYQWICW